MPLHKLEKLVAQLQVMLTTWLRGKPLALQDHKILQNSSYELSPKSYQLNAKHTVIQIKSVDRKFS